MQLSTRYNHKDIEDKWYFFWEGGNYFLPEIKEGVTPFVIVIPPLNVTGSLHLGHALDITLQDILIRYNRMKGKPTLWVPGLDHAGIAAQNVVEEELSKEGIHRTQIGHEAFLERMQEFRERYSRIITSQIKRLGASCDWSRERFTMDEICSRAVIKFFVRMYEKGYIYRGKYLINWCPRCSTAISDIEVEKEETNGILYHILYSLEDGGEVSVATSRPETMLGDTALAVHPEDGRYKSLKGKYAILPLIGRILPIVADEDVDPNFGTGVVKVTPAHDFLDYDISQRHNLDLISVVGVDGLITENGGKEYSGLKVLEAREKVISNLKSEGRILEEKPYLYSPGRCSRCDTLIEPLLSEQWFLKVNEIKKAAIEKVRDGEIIFIPEKWTKVYLDWMENLKDWCISRQLWWGHRIPAWICEPCGELLVQQTEPINCPKCCSGELKKVEDVLDTWFSSALWPFSVFHWPSDTEDLKYFYPTTVLVTGYDIITFWVSRMIMSGLELTNKPPFKYVYIHGLVRDEKGRKMSKSLGNVLDPLALADEYGTDALRFTLSSLNTLGGQDITLRKPYLIHSRNFMNKLWNASRFVISVTKENNGEDLFQSSSNLDIFDQFILTRLSRVVKEANKKLEAFDFSNYIKVLEDFFWKDYCDWYIEIAKLKKETADTSSILRYVLKTILVMLHPVIPFITEHIFHNLYPEEKVPLIKQKWVKEIPISESESSINKVSYIFDAVTALRNIKSLFKIKPDKKISVILHPTDAFEYETLIEGSPVINALAGVQELKITCELDTLPKHTATQVVRGTSIFVNLKGLVDLNEEKNRLSEMLLKLREDLNKIQKDLANQMFIEKANPQTVEDYKLKAMDLEKQVNKIEEIINYLGEDDLETQSNNCKDRW